MSEIFNQWVLVGLLALLVTVAFLYALLRVMSRNSQAERDALNAARWAAYDRARSLPSLRAAAAVVNVLRVEQHQVANRKQNY